MFIKTLLGIGALAGNIGMWSKGGAYENPLFLKLYLAAMVAVGGLTLTKK